jgi:SAM-dependent methyltransferase
MVGLARLRLPAAAPRLRQAGAEALPFASDSFDAVTGTGVFEYVRDRPAAFREIARVLRPGGLAVLSIPNPLALYALAYTVATPTGRLVRRLAGRSVPAAPGAGQPVRRVRFERLLRDAGLHVEAVAYTSFLVVPPPLDRAVPGLAERLAERFERAGAQLGGLLATQVLFGARLPREELPYPASR